METVLENLVDPAGNIVVVILFILYLKERDKVIETRMTEMQSTFSLMREAFDDMKQIMTKLSTKLRDE